MTKGNPFPALLRAFFQEWLAEQRSASVHTIRSYRDTWRLLLRFIAERKGGGVARMHWPTSRPERFARSSTIPSMGAGTIGTRNCRLAAIRSFFSFVADKDPEYVAQCAEVLTVPLKREPTSAPCYLEPGRSRRSSPSPTGRHRGMRDHVLLSFLYNSGARIQEALDLCSERDPVRCTELRSPLWQGAQGTDLSALAGNRDVAQEVAGTPTACARRADLRQSIR
jgi:site-specific recombinase XerD